MSPSRLRPVGQIGKPHADDGVARIFTRGNSGQAESGRQICRQIFQAVYCQIRAALQQRFLNLLRKEALSSNLSPHLVERYADDLVAGSLDDLDAAVKPQGSQLPRNPTRLPKRQRRPRCDDQHVLVLQMKNLAYGGDHRCAFRPAGL